MLLRPRTSELLRHRLAHRAIAKTPTTVLAARISFSSPGPSQLFRCLDEACPGGRIGFILSPPRYERAVALAIDARGVPSIVGKFAHAEDSAAHLRRESDILTALAAVPDLASSIPPLREVLPTHLGLALILDHLPGDPLPLEPPEAVRDWLRRCQRPERVPADATDLIRRVRSGLDRHPRTAVLRRMFRRAESILRDEVVPVTVVHGDFTPWNCLLDGERLRVFDWEFGTMRGLPGWDAAFWNLQVGLIRRRWFAGALAAAAEQVAMRRIDGAWELGLLARRSIVTLVLIDALTRQEQLPVAWYTDTVLRALEGLEGAGWLA